MTRPGYCGGGGACRADVSFGSMNSDRYERWCTYSFSVGIQASNVPTVLSQAVSRGVKVHSPARLGYTVPGEPPLGTGSNQYRRRFAGCPNACSPMRQTRCRFAFFAPRHKPMNRHQHSGKFREQALGKVRHRGGRFRWGSNLPTASVVRRKRRLPPWTSFPGPQTQ